MRDLAPLGIVHGKVRERTIHEAMQRCAASRVAIRMGDVDLVTHRPARPLDKLDRQRMNVVLAPEPVLLRRDVVACAFGCAGARSVHAHRLRTRGITQRDKIVRAVRRRWPQALRGQRSIKPASGRGIISGITSRSGRDVTLRFDARRLQCVGLDALRREIPAIRTVGADPHRRLAGAPAQEREKGNGACHRSYVHFVPQKTFITSAQRILRRLLRAVQ